MALLPYAFFSSLGYIGIFALSLLSSLIIFIPVPYLFVILFAALSGRFDPGLLILSSTGGATIGKMVLFQSFYSGAAITKAKTRENLTAFQTLVSRYAWLAVFIVASTPSPDDIVYVPLGIARYSRIRFLTALLAGKTVITALTVLGAGILSHSVFGSLILGEDKYSTVEIIIIGIIFAILAVLITYIINRIDWKKYIDKHASMKLRKQKLQ